MKIGNYEGLIRDLEIIQGMAQIKPAIWVLGNSVLQTKEGIWIAVVYLKNKQTLSHSKWTKLAQLAIELIEFFVENFVRNGVVAAPRGLKIWFWLRVGKRAFKAVKQVIEILRHG